MLGNPNHHRLCASAASLPLHSLSLISNETALRCVVTRAGAKEQMQLLGRFDPSSIIVPMQTSLPLHLPSFSDDVSARSCVAARA